MIEVIGVPFDDGGRRKGSRLGPIAARLEGLFEGFERIGKRANDLGDLTPISSADYWENAEQSYFNTKKIVNASIESGNTPLVIGGDHSNAIGSIAGALQKYGDKLAVLWIDAHMDLNTPETSPSGNVHGMCLAALCGLESKTKGWTKMVDEIVGSKKLDPKNLAWIGLRDVDPGEVANMRLLDGCLATTMHDIDAKGLRVVLDEVHNHFVKNGAKALWVSFDVDSLDPIHAPGTGTAVRGGLTYREGHYLAELIHLNVSKESAPYKLAGLDVVEVNPLIDHNNETAKVAVEWILSLFGKTILHPLDPGRTER